MEKQRHPAEDGNDHQAYPEHGVDLAVPKPDPGDLGEGRSDGDARGDVDSGELEGREEENDGEQVEKKFHDQTG